MTECTMTPDLFPTCKSRKVQIDFKGRTALFRTSYKLPKEKFVTATIFSLLAEEAGFHGRKVIPGCV